MAFLCCMESPTIPDYFNPEEKTIIEIFGETRGSRRHPSPARGEGTLTSLERDKRGGPYLKVFSERECYKVGVKTIPVDGIIGEIGSL